MREKWRRATVAAVILGCGMAWAGVAPQADHARANAPSRQQATQPAEDRVVMAKGPTLDGPCGVLPWTRQPAPKSESQKEKQPAAVQDPVSHLCKYGHCADAPKGAAAPDGPGNLHLEFTHVPLH